MIITNPKTFGALIEVVKSGASYHTFRDWRCTITNTDYIGDVVKEENYIYVPGMSGKLDVTETIAGRPVYKSRAIRIELAGAHDRYDWQNQISRIRNAIDGRLVKVIFDDDTGHYWKGRASVNKFDRQRQLGTFTIEIPDADPYKYEITSSQEPWLWDPFSFEDGVIRYLGERGVDDGDQITIPKGDMSVVPIITVTDILHAPVTVSASGVSGTFTLQAGDNRIPQIRVCGDTDVVLTFGGTANVIIDYRAGSL